MAESDLDVICYPCEYGAHGRWGKESSPAAYLVVVKCIWCGGNNMTLFMCHECCTADRIVSCGECGGEQSPDQAWTPTLRWF